MHQSWHAWALDASPQAAHDASIMKIKLNRQESHHHVHRAALLAPKRSGWIRSPNTRLWVTREGSEQDWIVASGQWHWIEPGEHWVVEAWHAGSPVDCMALDWLPVNAERSTTAWQDHNRLAAVAADSTQDLVPCPFKPKPMLKTFMRQTLQQLRNAFGFTAKQAACSTSCPPTSALATRQPHMPFKPRCQASPARRWWAGRLPPPERLGKSTST
jgi:hypothetical protein